MARQNAKGGFLLVINSFTIHNIYKYDKYDNIPTYVCQISVKLNVKNTLIVL